MYAPEGHVRRSCLRDIASRSPEEPTCLPSPVVFAPRFHSLDQSQLISALERHYRAVHRNCAAETHPSDALHREAGSVTQPMLLDQGLRYQLIHAARFRLHLKPTDRSPAQKTLTMREGRATFEHGGLRSNPNLFGSRDLKPQDRVQSRRLVHQFQKWLPLHQDALTTPLQCQSASN